MPVSLYKFYRNPRVTLAVSAGRTLYLAALAVIATLAAACDYNTRAIVGVSVGTTLLGARSPSHEIEQIYYLGVFDPREQVPEAIYRITVRGQASIISFVKFASGWVPAGVIDSLGGNVSMSMQGESGVTFGSADAKYMSQLQTGRRLVLFGPEGFREAPRDHRLVIVMGTSPEEFFKAIDTALGEFSQVKLEKDNAGLQRELMQAMIDLRKDQKTFTEIELETVKDFK
jgi:hypothetical protein